MTLDISPAEAEAKLNEYTGMIREERTAEDEAIAAGYRAARRGLPIINLRSAVAAGGYHGNGLPRIAVVRADARECSAWWNDGKTIIFADSAAVDRAYSRTSMNRGALVNQGTVRVEGLARPVGARNWWEGGATIVPIIPPGIRPRLRRIRGFHVLWEVEAWNRVPPRDPALIRHIRGDLWSVHAAWDLTELERHVLSQR
jgi:hypothetical protein